MHGSSGCLGCYTSPSATNSASKLSKELGVQDHTARKPSLSEDFWTTSTCDMDNSAAQSQGSISSISTNNQILDTHGGAGNANAPSEFGNHGKFLLLPEMCIDLIILHVHIFEPAVYLRRPSLLLWNQTRQLWVGNKKSENRAHVNQVQEPKLNWSATYESLLGSNKPFPQPIPLSEMVDFLVDTWEQEGMYD